MKAMFKIFTVLALLSFSTSAQAQIFKNLGNKISKTVERTVERKVEQKAEKATESTIDSILTTKKQKNKEKKVSNPMGNMSEMMEELMSPKDLKTEDSYNFPITATMQIINYENNKRVDEMTQSYGENAMYAIVKKTPNPILTDFKNEIAILLDLNAKTAQVMSLSWMKKMGQMGQTETEADNSRTSISKTGNTKTMNNYKCYEYKIANQNTTINAWLAPDVTFSYKDYLQGFTKMVGSEISNLPQDKGYIMQMDIYENGILLTKMEVTALSETPINVDLSKYTVSNIMGN